MTKKEIDKWALAIAVRISDEWSVESELDKDEQLLKSVLYKSLRSMPREMQKLIGTSIIESDYFEPLN